MTIKPLADDISPETAWREGRRVYIRCGYQSSTNTDLRDIGAKWDAEARALWVGSGKATKVIEILAAAAKRVAATQAVKTAATEAGLWVTIPYEAENLRAQAKQLGGRWDRDRKQWAMPTTEAHQVVATAAAAYHAAVEQDRQRRQQAEVASRASQAETEKTNTLTKSGRTTTGETAEVREVSTARYNRASAERAARPVGSVMRLASGRYGVITSVKVWFTGEDMASSVCWHAETHDEAHWDWSYTLAVVEPTAEETAQDAAEAAAKSDAAEIKALFRELEQAPRTDAGESASWSTVTGPRIVRRNGSLGREDGTVILDGDRAVYQHPGYYDDYRRSEQASADPALVSRVRAIIEAGDRTVGPYSVQAGV